MTAYMFTISLARGQGYVGHIEGNIDDVRKKAIEKMAKYKKGLSIQCLIVNEDTMKRVGTLTLDHLGVAWLKQGDLAPMGLKRIDPRTGKTV